MVILRMTVVIVGFLSACLGETRYSPVHIRPEIKRDICARLHVDGVVEVRDLLVKSYRDGKLALWMSATFSQGHGGAEALRHYTVVALLGDSGVRELYFYTGGNFLAEANADWFNAERSLLNVDPSRR